MRANNPPWLPVVSLIRAAARGSAWLGRGTAGLALAASLALGACAKQGPVVTAPVEREAPLPDPARLAATKAAEEGRGGTVRVHYCIDRLGKVIYAEAKESYDDEVARIVVETVEQWRFEPATRDGEPERACQDFDFDFRPAAG